MAARIGRRASAHIHHFFLPRAAQSLAALWRKAKAHPDARIRHMLQFFVEQAIWGLSVLNRYQPIQQGLPEVPSQPPNDRRVLCCLSDF